MMIPKTPEEITPILEALGKVGAVLIGGQCVNVWSQLYEDEKQDPWRSARPYTSFDVDVLSDKGEMLQIVGSLEERRLPLNVQYPRSPSEATVNTGLIVTQVNGADFGINLLHTAKGLSSAEVKETAVNATWRGISLRLLHPLLCVESKTYNLNTLEQDRPGERRQDRKHLLLSLGNLRQHLLARSTPAQEASCLRMARRLVDLAYHQMGLDTLTRHGVDILTGVPWAAWGEGKLASLRKLVAKETDFRQEIQSRLRAVEDLDAWVQKLHESKKSARKKD